MELKFSFRDSLLISEITFNRTAYGIEICIRVVDIDFD